jgi:predicted ABC-type ATPase
VEFVGRERLLDPDAIARRLNPMNPSAAAIAAGREVVLRTADYLDRGLSFAVETTLSSRSRVDLIREAKSRGFETHLVFIGLGSPDRCISRIKNRVSRGGHFVPDTDVRRRYARSIANAEVALRLADTAKFYDNCGAGHRLVLVANAGVVVWRAKLVPEWLGL